MRVHFLYIIHHRAEQPSSPVRAHRAQCVYCTARPFLSFAAPTMGSRPKDAPTEAHETDLTDTASIASPPVALRTPTDAHLHLARDVAAAAAAAAAATKEKDAEERFASENKDDQTNRRGKGRQRPTLTDHGDPFSMAFAMRSLPEYHHPPSKLWDPCLRVPHALKRETGRC